MRAAAPWDVETARAIERAVLDYFEGWFEGDAARMERTLHPELAKRTIRDGVLETDTAQEMIEATAAGVGRTRDVPDRRIEIEIAHVDGPTRASSSGRPSTSSTSTSSRPATGGRS